MINETIKNNIIKQVNNDTIKSPFLFLGKNIEILNSEVKNLGEELLTHFNIPKIYLYTFEDDGEKIKIKDIKSFIEYSNSKPPYKIQIFFIENISRLTLSASNSLLKFFEEPNITNVIFLTNLSESGIMDTILSRVQTINLGGENLIKKDLFVYSLIDKYIIKKDSEILSYYFKSKLEKIEYIIFLENLIMYLKNNFKYIEYLEEISEDLNAIKQNNVNAKYIIDKWLLKI